jgi:hypothetical protein
MTETGDGHELTSFRCHVKGAVTPKNLTPVIN